MEARHGPAGDDRAEAFDDEERHRNVNSQVPSQPEVDLQRPSGHQLHGGPPALGDHPVKRPTDENGPQSERSVSENIVTRRVQNRHDRLPPEPKVRSMSVLPFEEIADQRFRHAETIHQPEGRSHAGTPCGFGQVVLSRRHTTLPIVPPTTPKTMTTGNSMSGSKNVSPKPPVISNPRSFVKSF